MAGSAVFLKLEQNIQAKNEQICLRDLGDIYCSDKSAESKIRTLRLPTPQIHGPGRYVYSVVDVIQVIQKEYPSLDIQNLGESDFIITVEKQKKAGAAAAWAKTVMVCFLAFFGAAFSIMAFNNDVGVANLFGQLYHTFTGEKSNGFTILEMSYSVGVGLGILLFFHHFARKKGTSDPTPLEVEMRTYEDDVNHTMIEAKGRKQ